MKERRFFCGCDLGQRADYSALSVIEKVAFAKPPPWRSENTFKGPPPQESMTEYHVRHLQRWPLFTPYPKIVSDTVEMIEELEKAGAVSLAIDATGVGQPVVDYFKAEIFWVVAITITGGVSVNRGPGGYAVPKRDLATTVAILLEGEKIKVAKKLKYAKVLKEELENFRVKIRLETGHDSYEHWREKDHDDLLLSVAMPLWYSERVSPPDLSVEQLLRIRRGMGG